MSERISIEDFHKVEIRVGKILYAEKVEGSDKLLCLKVSFGVSDEESLQIVSGIAMYFIEAEVLVGRRVAFVTNLEPRIIRGLESQGMILAAVDAEGNFSLLDALGLPEKPITPGAHIQ